MIFKICEAEHDPVDQGYVEVSYDVIIACWILHATTKLDTTIRKIRKLLKPGGFLLIGEGSSESVVQYVVGLVFGTLPVWWLGVDEGRNLLTLASVSQWDTILDAMASRAFMQCIRRKPLTPLVLPCCARKRLARGWSLTASRSPLQPI